MTTPARTAPSTAATRRRVVYPSFDGKPLAETDTHRNVMVYGIESLKIRYADRPDACVCGGRPAARRA